MNDTSKIHFAYIIGILLAVDILVLTIKWGAIQELVNYLTFALTLTSLVLSLLAIVYAFFSNATHSRQAGMLERASKEIGDASGMLIHSTAELEKKVGNVPSLLQEMGSKVEATRVMVESYSNKFAEGAPPEKMPQDRAKMIERLAQYTSNLGFVALAVAHTSFHSKKSFTLKDIASKVSHKDLAFDIDYAYGWLIAFDCLGFLSISIKESIWTVTEFDSSLWDALKGRPDRLAAKNNPSVERIKKSLILVAQFFA
ncbi:MAG TPA: hypothetical protein VNL17_12680 [Verrucomicrobiae bacterium]|nr:hypothetical protein [Verrucomicrobiae bacterium]